MSSNFELSLVISIGKSIFDFLHDLAVSFIEGKEGIERLFLSIIFIRKKSWTYLFRIKPVSEFVNGDWDQDDEDKHHNNGNDYGW